MGYRNDLRFRSDADVASTLGVAVLATVPVMLTASERRDRKRKRTTRIVVLTAASILAGAGVVAALIAFQ
jgi:hypothetical protein